MYLLLDGDERLVLIRYYFREILVGVKNYNIIGKLLFESSRETVIIKREKKDGTVVRLLRYYLFCL